MDARTTSATVARAELRLPTPHGTGGDRRAQGLGKFGLGLGTGSLGPQSPHDLLEQSPRGMVVGFRTELKLELAKAQAVLRAAAHCDRVVVELRPRGAVGVSEDETASGRDDGDDRTQLRGPHDAAQYPLGLRGEGRLAAGPRDLGSLQHPTRDLAGQLERPEPGTRLLAHPVPDGYVPVEEPEVRRVVVDRPELLRREQWHRVGEVLQGG